MHPVNQHNFGYNGIAGYYGDGSGAAYTSYVVKQTGTYTYVMTNDGVNFVTASLVPDYDGFATLLPGQMTMLILGPNGGEYIKRLYSTTCVTVNDNVYSWTIDNSVDGSYVIYSFAYLQD